MRIPFLFEEGRFRTAIRNAIEQNARNFSVKVNFRSRGGASGSIHVTFEEYTYRGFETDWKGKNPRRFPARIRTATTALRDMNRWGTFLITHEDGILEIAEDLSSRASVGLKGPASLGTND